MGIVMTVAVYQQLDNSVGVKLQVLSPWRQSGLTIAGVSDVALKTGDVFIGAANGQCQLLTFEPLIQDSFSASLYVKSKRKSSF
jgi:hypothetical protein